MLDEPTTGMDPVARRAVWAAVDRRRAERGTTVLLVTHNVIEAETVLDRVAVLDRGRVIACDTPAGLKEQVARRGAGRAGVARARAAGRARGRRAARPARRSPGAAGRCGSRPTRRARPSPRSPAGAAFAALDDFTLATPSLEDVYLALGGAATAGAGEGVSTRRAGPAAAVRTGRRPQRDARQERSSAT